MHIYVIHRVSTRTFTRSLVQRNQRIRNVMIIRVQSSLIEIPNGDLLVNHQSKEISFNGLIQRLSFPSRIQFALDLLPFQLKVKIDS